MSPTLLLEETRLAPWPTHAVDSRGRRWDETFEDERSPYERDRDRIIHSAAFRRLEYKTQVFINHEGDYYRTRLTHSLEVSQIARSISRRLGLNADLAELLALAHDLGHPPFGHAGEDAMNECLVDHGGFEHNLHSLRVVEVLERRYPAFPGLNLTWEAREGLVKHSGRAPERYRGIYDEYDLEASPSLEAQLIDLADEIAYNNHDVDDGIESRLIGLDVMESIEIWARCRRRVESRYGPIEPDLLRYRTVSAMISLLIDDLVAETSRRLETAGIQTRADVAAWPDALVGFSEEVSAMHKQLKTFLMQNLYRHPHVEEMRRQAFRTVRLLYPAYLDDPTLIPERYRRHHENVPPYRLVADYIAGMTDRFAIQEYERLGGSSKAGA